MSSKGFTERSYYLRVKSIFSAKFTENIGICRGIVTADVLVQGLSRGAIAARKLKGVKRVKGHENYTGSFMMKTFEFRWDLLERINATLKIRNLTKVRSQV